MKKLLCVPTQRNLPFACSIPTNLNCAEIFSSFAKTARIEQLLERQVRARNYLLFVERLEASNYSSAFSHNTLPISSFLYTLILNFMQIGSILFNKVAMMNETASLRSYSAKSSFCLLDPYEVDVR